MYNTAFNLLQGLDRLPQVKISSTSPQLRRDQAPKRFHLKPIADGCAAVNLTLARHIGVFCRIPPLKSYPLHGFHQATRWLHARPLIPLHFFHFTPLAFCPGGDGRHCRMSKHHLGHGFYWFPVIQPIARYQLRRPGGSPSNRGTWYPTPSHAWFRMVTAIHTNHHTGGATGTSASQHDPLGVIDGCFMNISTAVGHHKRAWRRRHGVSGMLPPLPLTRDAARSLVIPSPTKSMRIHRRSRAV